MGRKPTINANLPARMRARRRGDKTYYYFDAGGKPRKEIALGTDYVLAVQAWARLNTAPPPVAITVAWLIGHYLASHDYTRLAAGSQADYKYALDEIAEHFGDAPLDQVRPSHITAYLDKRSIQSRHRALREVAVFGMLFRYAMAHDWATRNPVAPVRRERLPGRKAVYIEDEIYAAVYAAADVPLRDALDLAYLIGQRPGDVLALQESAIKDGVLSLRQTKTGAPIRLRVEGALATVTERILARKRTYPVRALALLVDERGRRLTKHMLRGRFEKARAQVPGAEHFQFRDLRAKAATDLREAEGIDAAQKLAGHKSVTMTEQYTRDRKGEIRSAIVELPTQRRGSQGGR